MNPILDRLFALMDERGLKPKQVTTELNMSNSSFTDWKKGKGSPSVDTLIKLSEYFDVSLDYLITGKLPDSDIQPPVQTLDFSNPFDEELLQKFHKLSPMYQCKALAYIDGMLAVLQSENQGAERLLG